MSNDALTSPSTSAMPLAAYAGDMTSHDGGRRGLQATLGLLSVIPFLSGLAGMLGPSLPSRRKTDRSRRSRQFESVCSAIKYKSARNTALFSAFKDVVPQWITNSE
jgi:hypothetical protein